MSGRHPRACGSRSRLTPGQHPDSRLSFDSPASLSPPAFQGRPSPPSAPPTRCAASTRSPASGPMDVDSRVRKIQQDAYIRLLRVVLCQPYDWVRAGLHPLACSVSACANGRRAAARGPSAWSSTRRASDVAIKGANPLRARARCLRTSEVATGTAAATGHRRGGGRQRARRTRRRCSPRRASC